MKLAIAVVGLGLALSEPAAAVEPYMWGVGPKIGTNLIPGRYPWALPKKVQADLAPDDEPAIDRVAFDIFFGVDGTYYINNHARLALYGVADVGRRFAAGEGVIRYNYVGQTGALDLLFGGGAGVGTMGFKGEGDARLKIPYFPLRLEGSALIRHPIAGFQGTIFGQMNIASRHDYTFLDGHKEKVQGTPFNYITIGVDLTVYFGDFQPPKKRKNG